MSLAHADARIATDPGWLRNAQFDGLFITGIAALGLVSAAVCLIEPRLFAPILLADLWLLGYHHVIATYTRLCFDKASFLQHRLNLFVLPLLVFAGCAALALGLGLWTLATLYFYWQWFHYARQSFGVAQVYRRRAGGRADGDERLFKATFYALPLWGILYRSHQDPGYFLGIELKVIPVPELAVQISGAVALGLLAWWIVGRIQAWREGRLAPAHTLYVASHFVVFGVAYILIEDVNIGWLAINIWHNAQYILFVWLFNNQKYKAGVDPKAAFLSRLSQTYNWKFYFGFCLMLTTVIYGFLMQIDEMLIAPIVIYQAINFHHYIVDGVIWKARAKPMRKTLGLAK